MKVLIAGKGFLGSNLGDRLEDEHEVQYLDRSSGEHQFDVTEPFEIDERFDLVFHTIGLEPGTHSEEEYRRVHVDGTRNIIEGVDFGKMVYISALGADSVQHPYMETKLEAERMVQELDSFTVLRPSIIFSRENRTLSRTTRFFPVLVVPEIGGELQPIHLQDMLDVMESCLFDHSGETLKLGGPEKMPLYVLFQRYQRLRGGRTLNLPFPDAVAEKSVKILSSFSDRPEFDENNLELLGGATAEPNDAERILGELRRVGID